MKTVDEAVLEKAVKALEDFAYRGRCDNWSEALIALDAVLEQPDQRSGPEPSVAQLNAILDGLGAAPGARQSAREFLRVWIRDWTMHKLALAQQEQEPVAWRVHPFDYGIGSEGVYAMTQRPDQVKAWERKGWTVQQLYIRPPRREWQGLTEEERDAAIRWAVDQEKMHFGRAVARAIEQALKEKNA